MDDLKLIVEDPIKWKIMSLFCRQAKIHINDIRDQANAPEDDLQRALDTLKSAKLLTRRGNFYKRNYRVMKVIASAIRGYEQTEDSLKSIGIDLPPSAYILDIGCGVGYDLHKLSKHSPNIFGIDYDTDSLSIARMMSPANAIRADAQFLPFKSNTFDFIFCFGVLGHVKDEFRAIAEAARVLREGGTIRYRIWGFGVPLAIIFKKNIELMRRVGYILQIMNTVFYWLINKKILLGIHISTFQSEKRMTRILNNHKISIRKVDRADRFMKLPRYVYIEGYKVS